MGKIKQTTTTTTEIDLLMLGSVTATKHRKIGEQDTGLKKKRDCVLNQIQKLHSKQK